MGPSEIARAPNARQPTGIRLRRKSALLELSYADGRVFELPAEFLRVYSPSADVKGHGKGQEVLQTGKRQVGLTGLEPMGNYAIRLDFDDGHNSGIFSWDYLYQLATQQQSLWQDYLDRLATAGKSRDALPAGTQVINIVDPARGP
ncbi:MAG: DUF971 domain-containing protein [Pseudohongiella sp.]|nr:DUF971 domain-containing protein [Pseudohongiella sp.]